MFRGATFGKLVQFGGFSSCELNKGIKDATGANLVSEWVSGTLVGVPRG